MASARKLILIAGGACAERIAIIGKGQVLAQDTRQRKMTLETPRLGLQSGVGHNLRLQWTIAKWRLLNNLKTFLHSLHNWISGVGGGGGAQNKCQSGNGNGAEKLTGQEDFYKNLICLGHGQRKSNHFGGRGRAQSGLTTRFFKLYSFSKLQCCRKRAAHRSSWKIARKI